jgi:ATP-dependent DNA helicase RecQ
MPSSSEAWNEKFDWLDPSFVFVFYDENRQVETIRQEIIQFASWLVQSCGVREISIDPASSIARHPDWSGLYKRTRDKVLLHRSPMESDVEPYSPLARLTVLNPDASADILLGVQMLQRPFHVVLMPLGMQDPGNSLRRLADVSEHKILLETVIQEISQ